MGLAVGSFAYVVFRRCTPDSSDQPGFSLWRSLQGRSYCDSCHKTLRWFELVPLLSFFVQQGRCRSCQARLSWQYPGVEFLFGLSFALISWRITYLFPSLNPVFLFLPAVWVLGLIGLWWLIWAVLLLIGLYDFKFYLIPDIFLYKLLGLGVVLNFYYLWLGKTVWPFSQTGLAFSGELRYLLGGAQFSLERLVFGMLTGTLVIGLAHFLSRGKAMGLGDVLLVLGLGLVFGWPDILLVMFLAFIFGTILSLGLMGAKRKTMKSIVPFAPFLVLAALTVILAGDKIISAYFSLFSLSF